MNPALMLYALLMQQGQNQNPDLGAMLSGQSPPGTAPSTSSGSAVPPAPSPGPGYDGLFPGPNAFGGGPAIGMGAGAPPTTTPGAPAPPSSPTPSVFNPPAGISVGSAPQGFDMGTQSPGSLLGPLPGTTPAPGAIAGQTPSPQAGAAGNPLAALTGFKAPPAPNPIMGGGVTGGAHPVMPTMHGAAANPAAQLQILLAALLGPRGQQPGLGGIPALGASLRGGV